MSQAGVREDRIIAALERSGAEPGAVARRGTLLRRAGRGGDLAAAVAVRDARVAGRRVAVGHGRDQAAATVAGAALTRCATAVMGDDPDPCRAGHRDGAAALQPSARSPREWWRWCSGCCF